MKDVEIKARVSHLLREKIEEMARLRDESMSLVIREAISEYLARRRPLLPAREFRHSPSPEERQ